MKIEFGYACINMDLGGFKSYNLRDLNGDPEIIKERIRWNFYQTSNVIYDNYINGINMYRLSSELVPLATHPLFDRWQKENEWLWFKDENVLGYLDYIKNIQQKTGMKLSLHPGQYTVLNSIRGDVVEKALQDLLYHYWLLNKIGGWLIIIHVGGVYGDKQKSKRRWERVFNDLPQSLKGVIALENDDKSFSLEDVLEISQNTGVLPLLDIHHENCNPSKHTNLNDNLRDLIRVWKARNLEVKIHLSSGRNYFSDCSHSDYVAVEDFNYVKELFNKSEYDSTLWVMLESKMKNKSINKLKEGLI